MLTIVTVGIWSACMIGCDGSARRRAGGLKTRKRPAKTLVSSGHRIMEGHSLISLVVVWFTN